MLITTQGLWPGQWSTISRVKKVQLIHKHGKATNQTQLTQKCPTESMPFHQITYSSSENVDLAFFNALHLAFNANLYSCQLLFFSSVPAELHWPT